MSEKFNSETAVIGIDIGKNSFHIVGQDRRGSIVLRQKWSRGQPGARLVNLPPCLSWCQAHSCQQHSCSYQKPTSHRMFLSSRFVPVQSD